MDLSWTERAKGRTGGCLLAVLLIILGLTGAPTLSAATISDVQISADRITLRFDGAVEKASAFTLDGPRRIAIDVTGAEAGQASASGGVVAATRQAQNTPSTARVVLDLAEPAIVTRGDFATDGRSLTLSVTPVDAAVFRKSVRAPRIVFKPRSGAASVRIPLDPSRNGSALATPPVSGARGTNRPLVVIDAGHGGHDPGSLSLDGKRKEKDAALAIARAIRDELVSSGRVRVAMTRDRDSFLVLRERREIARRLNASLFISVHADSAANHDARGATIYTLSEVASDRYAAQLAARENRADILNGVNLGGENGEVSSILFDLAQRETMNVSAGFAALLQREMSPNIHFKDEFHRFAGLAVLKAPDMPSVLLETGYISNEEDEKLLFSREYQRDIAIGVRRAVEAHFARQLAVR